MVFCLEHIHNNLAADTRSIYRGHPVYDCYMSLAHMVRGHKNNYKAARTGRGSRSPPNCYGTPNHDTRRNRFGPLNGFCCPSSANYLVLTARSNSITSLVRSLPPYRAIDN
jgi:hypothetical protein